MTSFPALARNLLLRAADEHGVDFFWVGPADASFERGGGWLSQLPGLRRTMLYAPRLGWSHAPGAGPLASFRNETAAADGRRGSRASFNLHGLSCGMPASRLKSRLVQAMQAQQCLRLIEQEEASAAAGKAWRYAAVLRARADLLLTAPVELPRLAPHSGATSALTECPPPSERLLAPHDFALYGARRAMGHVLGALDGLLPAELQRHRCDFGVLGAGRLRQANLPLTACHAPRNRSAVASVRGSASGRCFFVDQEHPPNDGQPQPRLGRLYAGADGVATACLGLAEQRDGRRPGSGPACRPHGGWDGDFRTDASPWDAPGSAANRGNGRRN